MEFKWTFKAIRTFENASKRILKQQDIKVNGQPAATNPLHAGAILANFIKMSDIMAAAVAASLSAQDLDKKPTEAMTDAESQIQSMLDGGMSLEDIQNDIYRSYLETNDPSSIAIWEAARKRDQEARAKILEKSSGESATT